MRSPQESQPGPGVTGGAGRAAGSLLPPSPSAGSVPLSSVPPPQSDGCVRAAAAPFSGAALPGLLAATCLSMAGKRGPKHPARSSCSLWVTARPEHLRPGSVSAAPQTDKPHPSASEKPACSRCDPSPSWKLNLLFARGLGTISVAGTLLGQAWPLRASLHLCHPPKTAISASRGCCFAARSCSLPSVCGCW